MAIGIETEKKSGGKFLPTLKYDAKSGDLVARNREPQSDGTWDTEEVEIALPHKFVMDLHKLEVGYMSFAPGNVGFSMVQVGEKLPPKPSNDHKLGIRIRMFSKEHGLRELSQQSKNFLRRVDELHDAFTAEHEKHAGKMPVITWEGNETVKQQTPQGELKFKVPKWSITGWVDAPSAFAEWEAGSAPAAPAPAPEAPIKKAKPAPVTEEVDEF